MPNSPAFERPPKMVKRNGKLGGPELNWHCSVCFPWLSIQWPTIQVSLEREFESGWPGFASAAGLPPDS